MHQAANGSTERKTLINTKSQQQSHPTRRTRSKWLNGLTYRKKKTFQRTRWRLSDMESPSDLLHEREQLLAMIAQQ